MKKSTILIGAGLLCFTFTSAMLPGAAGAQQPPAPPSGQPQGAPQYQQPYPQPYPPPPQGQAPAQYPPPGYPPPGQPGTAPPGYPPPGYPPPGYPPPGQGYPPGYAPPPPGAYGYGQPMVDPTAHRHDGFFLRMMAGPGFLRASNEEDGVKTKLSGPGLSLEISLGGALTDNLVLYGTVAIFSVAEPEAEVSAGGQTMSRDLKDVTFSSGGAGAGIAYYFMPMNLHVGGGVLLTNNRFEIKDNDPLTPEEEESDSGLGVNLNVGKEWFVSAQWGLGVNGQLYMSRNEGATSVGLGLNFAATFN